MMEKRRSAGAVSGSLLAGEVDGARVLVIDDLIASGGTMVRAANAMLEGGARDVWALAAHGLFTGGAEEALTDRSLAGVIVTDTIPAFRLEGTDVKDRIETVTAAPLFAEAIRRLHEDREVGDLIAGES